MGEFVIICGAAADNVMAMNTNGGDCTKADLTYLLSEDMCADDESQRTNTYHQFTFLYIGQYLNRGQVKLLTGRLITERHTCHQLLDDMKSDDKVALFIVSIMEDWFNQLEEVPTWTAFISMLRDEHFAEYIVHLRKCLADKGVEQGEKMDNGLISELVASDDKFPVTNKQKAITFAKNCLGFEHCRAERAVDNVIEESTDTVYYGSKLFDHWKQSMPQDTALRLIECIESIKFDRSKINAFIKFLLQEFRHKIQARKEEVRP